MWVYVRTASARRGGSNKYPRSMLQRATTRNAQMRVRSKHRDNCTVLSGNEILMSVKGRNFVKILRKITGNNPKLDLVSVDVHTKYGQILSICS